MMFYKETDFKETPIGKIPKDWKTEKLGNICTKITDGTHKTPKYVEKGIPFFSTENIVPFKKGFDFSKYEKYISLEEHKELIKRCKPEKGDILISKCGTIGRAKLVDVDYEFSIFVGLALLKLKKDLVNGRFLEQLLNYEPVRIRMEISSPGSTRKTLTINAIENLLISLPPLVEQQKITEILSTIDEAVQKTDEIIAKTERLKKGLMQELLSGRIRVKEENGKLIFWKEKDFKDTEIGRIPKDWEVVKLGEIFTISVGGDLSKLNFSKQKNEKFRFPIYSNSLENDGLYGYADSYQYPENCITVTARGTLGYAIPRFEKFNAIIRLLVLIPKIKVDIKFVSEYINTKIKFKLEKTSIPQLTAPKLANYKICLPPLKEQQKIAEILFTIDKKLELERKRKEKLERIKQGMMDLLLTGKIRVKVK